eukprot:s583_g9.t1
MGSGSVPRTLKRNVRAVPDDHPGHAPEFVNEEKETKQRMRETVEAYDDEYDMVQDKFEELIQRQSAWRSVTETPEGRIRKRVHEESSPGRTPKSAVQKSLARLGMINSPDRREILSTLEEFLAQFVDAKDLGLDEEDVRSQMAATAGLSLKDFTQTLYDQAVEEQRKGTKGLTKFLAKWRKQLAAEPASVGRGSNASWSVVGSPEESHVSTTPESARTMSSSTTSGLVKLPPPGIYGADDRKAGTGASPQDQAMMDIAKAIQHQTTELATLVGNGEHGGGLAQALLAAQAGASTKLRNAGFRQKVTPRLAVGLAGPFWGTQEKHALSVADFVPCSDAELDQHAVECRTGKPINEQRPPAPTRYEDWASRVKRQTDVWALVYGKEWRAVKEHAAQLLGEWHLGAPHRWPLQIVSDVWEELHWRFFEELKQELRKIKSISGRETMTLSDLKFYALMPNEEGQPPLQLPRTFDLNFPDGWFMTEVLPRIERRQERMLWKLTWEGAAKSRGSGQAAGGSDGKAEDKVTLKALLGPKLTVEETNRAKDRAPVGKDGKLLCWGFLSHLGCNQANCQRAHEHLKGSFEALDPAVQMQLLKRGGLKRMRQETKETAVDKIKELRQQVAQDKSAKIQDGQARRRAGQETQVEEVQPAQDASATKRAGGVTWQAPVEMIEIDYTKQEQQFADLVEGPSQEVFKHQERDGVPHGGRQGSSAPKEAQELLRRAQSLAEGPVLSKLQNASDDLYAWAATRVANDPSITLELLLEDMVQFGLGELAAEAAKILEEHAGEKAGSSRRCVIHETVWTDEGPGRAMVEIDGESWVSYDYREEIQMTEELAGLLGVVVPEVEKRQCVMKVLAAGHLRASHQGSDVPSMSRVQELAQQFRLEQARMAVEAEGVMGHPENRITAIEHELRMYTHDILKAHHDKDYRALAVFPLEVLEATRVVVLRVDYKGDYVPEVVQGSHWKAGQSDIWAMIWKGHMTLLEPLKDVQKGEILARFDVYTTPSLGFRYFWHQRHDQPRTAPGILACRHCKPLKKAGASEVETVLRKTSCLAAAACCAAGGRQEVYHVRPASQGAGPTGLCLREYFAGHGVMTEGWLKAGERAMEPIEFYTHPHLRQGPRPDHDLSQPAVQERYLQEIDADVTNVEWLACPCTTFCDWNLQNHGTRTFENPMGTPNEKEALGNQLAIFEATAFERALDRGHFPIAESSGRSGRYPKMWHLPCWQKILQRPDVDFLEIDMCAYGLAPLDASGPHAFYKHRTGLAFPRHPAFRQALFRVCCGPGIAAVGCGGGRPHGPYPQLRQAGGLVGSKGGFRREQVPGRSSSSSSRSSGSDDEDEAEEEETPVEDMDFEAEMQDLFGDEPYELDEPYEPEEPYVPEEPYESEEPYVPEEMGFSEESDVSAEHEEPEESMDEERRLQREAHPGGPEDPGDAGDSDGSDDEEMEESTTPTSVADSPPSGESLPLSDGEPLPELAMKHGDECFYNEGTGLLWIWHKVARRRLVVPRGEGCPFPEHYFKPDRWTRCERAESGYPAEVVEIHGDWPMQEDQVGLFGSWTGWTVFQVVGYESPISCPWDLGQDFEDGPGMASQRAAGGNPEAEGGGSASAGPNRGTYRLGEATHHRGSGESVSETAYVAARNYVQVIDDVQDQEVETWRKIRKAGSTLLTAAGTVQQAAEALWQVREDLGRHNLQGVEDADLEDLLHPDHLAYLRDVRRHGMPARYVGERQRIKTDPHPRARANLPQVFRQLFKDVSKHRILVVDADHPGLQHTASSPFEAVPKMLPNRALSTEVRLVHDQRGINSGTSKELHPPAI